MTVKISALPTIGSVDRAADYLAIVDTSLVATDKVTPNNLLGITGNPLGTSDTQNITNKTLDNTNTITLKDTLFTLQDDGDATKQVKFQLSGVTTGNTRTLTVPNASVTLASLTGTETFTNKTLTSPIISGGTIDNSTITVDSISGHTSATIVTVGGVQLNNGTIGTASAVVTNSIADAAVTPAKLVAGTGTGWSYAAYTPTWTGSGGNPAIGNGTLTGFWQQTGKTVNGHIRMTAGGTTTFGSGTYSFGLPTAASASYDAFATIGHAQFDDTSAATAYLAIAIGGPSATALTMRVTSNAALVTNTAPTTFASGDTISISYSYRVD